MNKSTQQTEAHFEAALALKTPQLRAQYLDRHCPDPELRQEVESLLEAHDHPDPLLETITLRLEPVASEQVGMKIGRYKLLEQLGEGGCGVVYVAEQSEPLRRRVALKVIRLGMDTKTVVARFEAERQALAMMDHPNIAKVLDAGTTEQGRPYFVMELVRGIPITHYCDQNHLGTRDRLGLFIQVCRAIQHAHQKGIIHRDIKPSNILVTLHDGVPVPKVIDFGIAKAIEGRLTDATVYTQLHQFIGTPAYMSPEQAEMSGLDIDTRSDIYSLGVLLYELLAGSTPFNEKELMAAGIDSMRRTIREREPARPSNRLATLPGEVLTTAARRRSTDTSNLVHQLRGDVDWIVMKCLEKDRARRYDTADSLADDIRRHLANEPIQARPPSNLYRLQKLLRRNRSASVALVAVILGLGLGVGLAVAALVRERSQSARTDAVTGFVNQLLSDTLPPLIRQGNVRATRELIQTTDRLVASSLSNAPLAELAVRGQLWKVFIMQLGDYPAALQQGEAIGRLAPRIPLIGAQLRQKLVRLFLGGTRLWASGGDPVQQEAALRELDALHDEVMHLSSPERLLAGECRSTQGIWLLMGGRVEQAEKYLAEACELLPMDPGTSRQSNLAVPFHAQALSLLGKPEQAEQILRKNINLEPESQFDARALHLRMVGQWVDALCLQGKFNEAVQILADRRAWLMGHDASGMDLNELDALRASVVARSGDLRQAAQSFETLSTNRYAGPEQWRTAVVLALAVSDPTAYQRLVTEGILRYASVVEDHGALLLAEGLLAGPVDPMTLDIARVMVDRVAEAHDWSRDLLLLLRSAISWREGRQAEAVQWIDAFRAEKRFGIFRAGFQSRPAPQARIAFVRALLCAELGRGEEALKDYAQGCDQLKRSLPSATSHDLGSDWVEVCAARVQQQAAEQRLKAQGLLPLPSSTP